MEPLVSILITLYNREDFISQTLDSVLNMNFQNYEVIVCDDNSNDNSVIIVEEYVQRDSRIKLYKNPENLGDYKNRNQAAKYANGKYLKYLDADDIIYPYSLQIMVDAMEQHLDASIGLSYNVIDDNCPYPCQVKSRDAIISFLYGKNVLGVGPSASIIRRKDFEEVGGFSGTKFIGDIELWVKLVFNSPLVKLQPSLVWWRKHEGQQIVEERKNYKIAAQRYLHKLEVIKSAEDILNEFEIENALKFNLYRQLRLFWNVLIKKRDFRNALILKRESKIAFKNLFFAFSNYRNILEDGKHNNSFI